MTRNPDHIDNVNNVKRPATASFAESVSCGKAEAVGLCLKAIEHTAAPGGQRPIRWCPGLEAGPQRSTLLLKNTIINLEIQNNNNAAITIKVTIKVQTRMDNRVRLSVDHRMK